MRLAVRAAETAGSELGVLEALSDLSKTHRAWVPTTFDLQEHVVASQNERHIHFPRPMHRENHRTILRGYVESLHGKYQMEGFCEVEEDDVVIDCGAYVGGFALSVAPIASRLVLIEPAPVNHACCATNLANFPQATALQMGLFDRSANFALQMTKSDVDHSFLTPDHGATGKSITVQSRRLDDLAAELGLDRIDFFKLEAEGAEIEAIAGMGDLRPAKISIDAGPERYGKSPAPELTETLEGYGYEVRVSGHTLCAVR
jgi:FkbM family methyltransferase